jgi:hypothetical protein
MFAETRPTTTVDESQAPRARRQRQAEERHSVGRAMRPPSVTCDRASFASVRRRPAGAPFRRHADVPPTVFLLDGERQEEQRARRHHRFAREISSFRASPRQMHRRGVWHCVKCTCDGYDWTLCADYFGESISWHGYCSSLGLCGSAGVRRPLVGAKTLPFPKAWMDRGRERGIPASEHAARAL